MSSTSVDNINNANELNATNNNNVELNTSSKLTQNNLITANSSNNSRQSTPPNLIYSDSNRSKYTPLISKAKPTIMTISTTASASVSAANSRPSSWISTGTTRPISTHSTLLDRTSSPALSREGSIKESSSGRSLNKQLSRNSLASALTAHLDRLFIAKSGSDIDAASVHSQPYLPSPTSLPDQMTTSSLQNGGSLGGGSLNQAISPPNSDLIEEVIEEEGAEEAEGGSLRVEGIEFESGELTQKLKELDPSLTHESISVDHVNNSNNNNSFETLDSDLDSEGEEFNASYHRRKYGSENTLSPNWKKFEKHFFILSSAGKPIYSRYGDESQLSGLMGIIQAMVSVFLDDKDPIRFINIGPKKVIFLIQDHIYYIMVSNTSESELILRDQLQIFSQQVLSLVTLSQIQKIFAKRRNYDLRGMLSGTEIFLDSICKRLSSISPSHLFKAIRPQRLTKEIRVKLSSSLKLDPIPNGLLYIMLVSKYKLLHLTHSKKVTLNPTDLHLILNLIHSSPNFNTLNQESWLPICLPKFNSTGFLHALIYPVSHKPLLSLILLTSNKDSFFELRQLKESILTQLEEYSLLNEMLDRMLESDYLPIEFNSRGLRHFYFKNLLIGQFIGSKFESPFVERSERKRIFSLYQSAYTKLHNPDKPIRLHFEVTEFEIILGWITPGFELYATYDQFMTKSTILDSALALIKGIKLKQDNLFITQIPTF